MESVSQNKGFLITILVTIVLLVGGIFLFSQKTDTPSTSKKVSDTILVPENSIKTSTGSAEITLVEFGDYQCPACGVYHPFVKKLLSESNGKINFVFRHFPLTQHKNALLASYAVIAAGKQNKYWEMHDKLFESQTEWSDLSNPKDKFIEYAKSFNLDIKKFDDDTDSKDVKEMVTKDLADGNLANINATPTYYVNGNKIDLPNNYEDFKNLVFSLK